MLSRPLHSRATASEPRNCSARTRHSSVLPVPDGPTTMAAPSALRTQRARVCRAFSMALARKVLIHVRRRRKGAPLESEASLVHDRPSLLGSSRNHLGACPECRDGRGVRAHRFIPSIRHNPFIRSSRTGNASERGRWQREKGKQSNKLRWPRKLRCNHSPETVPLVAGYNCWRAKGATAGLRSSAHFG